MTTEHNDRHVRRRLQDRVGQRIAVQARMVGWESMDGGVSLHWNVSPAALVNGQHGDCGTIDGLLSIFAAEEIERIREALQQLFLHRESFELSASTVQANQRLRLSGLVELDSQGSTRFSGLLRDVSVETQAAITVLEARARLDLALEAAKIGLWEWHVDSNELQWDAVTTAMLGIRVNEGSQRLPALWRRLGPAQARHLAELPERFASGAESAEGELSLRGGPGIARHIRYSCRVLPGGIRRPTRLIGTVWDITHEFENRRLIEEHRSLLTRLVEQQTSAALQARDSEREARMAQAQFFLNCSHELRTPLHSMIGYTQLVVEAVADLPLAERARGYLSKAEAAARRQLRLVDDLLDLAKLQSATVKIESSGFDLRDVITDAADEQRPIATARRIHLHCNLPEQECAVSADRDRVLQVLRNLLSNALKFTPEHGEVSIHLNPARDAPSWRIHVCDTGCGIAASEREAIFEQFRQGSLSRDVKGGVGLGLPIAREIARAHGGSLVASNRAEGGACFELTIPRCVVLNLV